MFQINHLVNFRDFFNKFNSGFSYIEVWFTDQRSRPPETEDRIIIALVIKE